MAEALGDSEIICLVAHLLNYYECRQSARFKMESGVYQMEQFHLDNVVGEYVLAGWT
jgi:hypothetical protein